MSSICISFFVSELRLLWLLRIFVFSGCILHFFSTFLEVAQHVLKLFFGGRTKARRRRTSVREAVVVVVAQVDSHSFFLLPALGDVFQ